MPSDRLIVLLLALAFLAAFVGIPWMLWWERRRPSSFTRGPEYLASAGEPSLGVWRGLSTDQQAAYDEAALDRAEQAEIDARHDAQEAAEFLAHQVRVNAQYHP